MPTDPRPPYARATTRVARLIGAVRPEQLTGPAPCTELDARTLLSPAVGGTRRIALAARAATARPCHCSSPDVHDEPVPAPEGAGARERPAAWLGRRPLSRA
ncbi:hypothetical protein [Streptomyces sp. NPDC048521]|uniref:hypothetical protein n=1 Tax=Streptomyces sp. NPDC048521 TaxID=3365566 RepID=UPI0037159173